MERTEHEPRCLIAIDTSGKTEAKTCRLCVAHRCFAGTVAIHCGFQSAEFFPENRHRRRNFTSWKCISLVNRVTATVSRPAVARRALSNSHTLSLIISTIPSFFCCHSPPFSSSPFLSPKYYKSIGTIRSETDMKQTKQVRLKINVTVALSTDVTRFTHIGPPPSRSLLSYSYNGL